MKERVTAIALLCTFLLGVVLAFISLFMRNNVLSGMAVLFILAGAVGTFAMRRGRQQREQAAKEEKWEMKEAFGEDEPTAKSGQEDEQSHGN